MGTARPAPTAVGKTCIALFIAAIVVAVAGILVLPTSGPSLVLLGAVVGCGIDLQSRPSMPVGKARAVSTAIGEPF